MGSYGILRARALVVSAAVVVASALAGSSCKSNSIASTTNNGTTIGPSGGTVNGPDGSELRVPAGALTKDTSISIAEAAPGDYPALPSQYIAIGKVFAFEPHGLEFLSPTTIDVPYTASSMVTPFVLHAEPGGQWEMVTSTSDGMRAEILASTFSFYVVAQGGSALGDAGDQDTGMGGGAACDPPSTSVSNCVMNGGITCSGIGSSNCACTTNLGPSCQGSKGGSAPCKATWSCNGVMESCEWDRYDQDAGAGNGLTHGGSGANCASLCATNASVAAAMEDMAKGCGWITMP